MSLVPLANAIEVRSNECENLLPGAVPPHSQFLATIRRDFGLAVIALILTFGVHKNCLPDYEGRRSARACQFAEKLHLQPTCLLREVFEEDTPDLKEDERGHHDPQDTSEENLEDAHW